MIGILGVTRERVGVAHTDILVQADYGKALNADARQPHGGAIVGEVAGGEIGYLRLGGEAGGIHGYGMRRYIGYTLESGQEAWTKAMDNVVIAIMIEKKGAVENLEEILSIKGVDMVQFGPADYSISIGKPGQRQAPEVLKAEKDTIEKALKMGVAPRVEVASFEQTKAYIEMGVRHFCIGWDIRIIHSWCKEQAEGMRKLLKL